MPKSRKKTIQSRLVFNFPGFEAADTTHQLERMTGNGLKFARVWNCDFSRVSTCDYPDDHFSIANFWTNGKNWQTTTKLIQFDWLDIIAEYEGKSHLPVLFRNFLKYLAFFLDGTILRYFLTHWRYGIFSIYPLVAIMIFIIVSWIGARSLVNGLFGPSLIGTSFLTILFAMTLNKWLGNLWYVSLSINDWGFARDIAKNHNPVIEKRHDAFAIRMISEIKKSKDDEIVITAHSLGVIWAVQALARVLVNAPDILQNKKVTFLSMGSSLPKINLVPSAREMRKMSKIVMSQPKLLWNEIQTRIDFIAFYGTNPTAGLCIKNPETEIHVHKVRYSRVMNKKRYTRLRKSFYRSHRQYIMYQDIRCHFDFFIQCFGPISVRDMARQPEIINCIDNNGRLNKLPIERKHYDGTDVH